MMIMNTYNRLPVSFTHGEGIWLYDENGKKYLDAISGIGVNALGHAHPAVVEAISAQAGRVIHTSNLYGIGQQEKLAGKLAGISGMEKVFFANSGAEANEAAIKLAHKHAFARGKEYPEIIVTEGAFHGRTIATLSATEGKKIRKGFYTIENHFKRVPYNDAAAVEKAIGKNTTAVMVEPVQGEGGICIPDPGYLKMLREICDKNDLLLIFDEVQTGNGRTGKYFAFQHSDILPDVLTTAKGLANGVPIGACLAGKNASELFQPGSHASTFGGNFLACTAANSVVDTIIANDLAANAQRTGALLVDFLKKEVGDKSSVAEIRGMGLMIGIELKEDCPDFTVKALEAGLLVNVTRGKVIRLLPPLIITEEETLFLAGKLGSLIKEYLKEKEDRT